MERKVRKIGEFPVGSFGYHPAGECKHNTMTLWTIEPDFTRRLLERHPDIFFEDNVIVQYQ